MNQHTAKFTWLVTWRGKRGGTRKRRFNTKWLAVEFMETALFDVHPTDKTLDFTGKAGQAPLNWVKAVR